MLLSGEVAVVGDPRTVPARLVRLVLLAESHPERIFLQRVGLKNHRNVCAAENLAMTFAIALLFGRRSLVPFVLAMVSGLFGMNMRNPLCVLTAAYLFGATCPSDAGRLTSEQADLAIGFSPELPPSGKGA